LIAACGGAAKNTSGTTSGGASNGAAPTTGGAATTGSTGGTSGSGGGAATTGAISTGGGSSGGLLAAGQPCSFDAVCASGICGIGGSGNCCVGPKRCPLGEGSDVVCDPTGCDDTGACMYPGPTTACGMTSCEDGVFTPVGNCNGAGLCDAGTPFLCHSFGCTDAGACKTTCKDSADCAMPFKCNGGNCYAARSSGPCTEDDDCVSDMCALPASADAGPGNCCQTTCMEGSNPICNSMGCDATTGACLYPEGMVCANSSCANSKSITNTCDILGNCLPTASDCPNDFGCNSERSACNTSCMANTDCASGFFCDAGACGS
jgi:hypothetical protein